MLRDWQRKHPGRVENMFTALQNVVPSHLLDARLHDFVGLTATGVADPDGDHAFDAPAFIAQREATGTSSPIAVVSQ